MQREGLGARWFLRPERQGTDYALFTEELKRPASLVLFNRLTTFIAHLSERSGKQEQQRLDPRDLALCVQRLFEQADGDLCSARSPWCDCSDEELSCVRTHVERYVTRPAYGFLLEACRSQSASEAPNLGRRLRALKFLSCDHLGIPKRFQVGSPWTSAQEELSRLPLLTSPAEKLEAVVRCCKHLLSSLVDSVSDDEGAVPGADELLTSVVFVIVNAPCPDVHAHLLFIEHFRHASELRGEGAYFLAMVTSAVQFVVGLSAKQLVGISSPEFERRLRRRLINIEREEASLPPREEDTLLGILSDHNLPIGQG